jgi:hypothetical protein
VKKVTKLQSDRVTKWKVQKRGSSAGFFSVTLSLCQSVTLLFSFITLSLISFSCGKHAGNPANPTSRALEGRVLENGAGLAGVTVRATAEGFERLAVTDSAGVYRMDGIPDGRYTLTPVGIGYRFEPPTLVTAVEGKDTEAAEFHAIRESPGVPVTVEGITFIPIPAGGFRMGSATGPKNERPLHTVTLDSLLAGATEITQGQYRSLTGKNPSYTSGLDLRPVEQVS